VPKRARASRARFTPPGVAEVRAYLEELGESRFTAETFVDYYEACGWKRGKTPMTDWRGAVRTWRNRENGNGRKPSRPGGSRTAIANVPVPAPAERRVDRIDVDEAGVRRLVALYLAPDGTELRRSWCEPIDELGQTDEGGTPHG